MKLSTERVRELDRRLVALARNVRVLTSLGWPLEVEHDFLGRMAKGSPRLPEVPPEAADFRAEREALGALRAELDLANPLERVLDRSAESFQLAASMLEAAGTLAFTELSVRLYGHPADAVHPGAPTHLQAAEHFGAHALIASLPPPEEDLDAEEAAEMMRHELSHHFGEDVLPVEVDDRLSAKATAGSTRVRLRRGARFSRVAVLQLVHHEALVHAATKRNGRGQPLLTSLGLSTPRTTCTQEGLATMAEMITDTMDLHRLLRVALRIRAIAMALDGADFIEVYRFFVDQGQAPTESFHSAQRVFRGGDVRGGIVFTKDVVYLKGLATVHTFLLKAIQEGRHRLPQVLFCGRMDLADALDLEPFFGMDGVLAPPAVLPAWVRNEACLAAYLTWTAYNDRIDLDRVSLDDFRST